MYETKRKHKNKIFSHIPRSETWEEKRIFFSSGFRVANLAVKRVIGPFLKSCKPTIVITNGNRLQTTE